MVNKYTLSLTCDLIVESLWQPVLQVPADLPRLGEYAMPEVQLPLHVRVSAAGGGGSEVEKLSEAKLEAEWR